VTALPSAAVGDEVVLKAYGRITRYQVTGGGDGGLALLGPRGGEYRLVVGGDGNLAIGQQGRDERWRWSSATVRESNHQRTLREFREGLREPATPAERAEAYRVAARAVVALETPPEDVARMLETWAEVSAAPPARVSTITREMMVRLMACGTAEELCSWMTDQVVVIATKAAMSRDVTRHAKDLCDALNLWRQGQELIAP
jgi:hypothetical protein